MLFRIGEKVRYEGMDIEKLGLKSGMKGEVVRCYKDSVDVFYHELQRVVNHQDFHMRICLKRTT